VPYFGSISLNKLDSGTIDVFLQNKLFEGLAPNTVDKYKKVLHVILGQAVAEVIINRNPVDYCMTIPLKENDRTIIENEDLSLILNEAKSISSNAGKHGRCYGQSFFCYPILMTASHTGMRIGEIFALRWENIDLDKRIIYVKENVTEAKNEQGKIGLICDTTKTTYSKRVIDISDTLCELLKGIRAFASPEKGIVFATKTQNYIAPSNFGRVWRKLLEDLGMKGKYKIHEFRHTHATLLIAARINPVSVSKRLGHASPQTTLNVYAHAITADGRRMADLFNEVK